MRDFRAWMLIWAYWLKESQQSHHYQCICKWFSNCKQNHIKDQLYKDCAQWSISDVRSW
jgi:hypothetical protein